MNLGKGVNEIKNRLEENGYIGKEIDYKELKDIYDEYGSGMGEIDFAKSILNMTYAGYNDLKYGNAKITLSSSSSEVTEPIRKENIKEESVIPKLEPYFNEADILFNKKDATLTKKNDTIKKYKENLVPKIDDTVLENKSENEFQELKESHQKEESDDIYSKNYLKMLEFTTSQKYDMENVWFGKTTMSKDFVNSNWDNIIKITETALNNTKRRYGTKYNKNDSEVVQEAAFYLVKNRGDIEKNFQGKEDMVNKLIYLSVARYINCKTINLNNEVFPKTPVNKCFRKETFEEKVEELPHIEDLSKLLKTHAEEKINEEIDKIILNNEPKIENKNKVEITEPIVQDLELNENIDTVEPIIQEPDENLVIMENLEETSNEKTEMVKIEDEPIVEEVIPEDVFANIEPTKEFNTETLNTDIDEIKEELSDGICDEETKTISDTLGTKEKTILASMRMYLATNGKKITDGNNGDEE